MSGPTLGIQSGRMFTSDALQQMVADHRSRMMAQACDARAVHAAAAIRTGRSGRRRHVPSWRPLIRTGATLRHS